ncbi:MAG: hypothetical protein ACREM2_05165, partial [Vulcanimicrobiaceae bacterium]
MRTLATSAFVLLAAVLCSCSGPENLQAPADLASQNTATLQANFLALERSQFEQTFPKGSSVYSYDRYFVLDGNEIHGFSIGSIFNRDPDGLHVTDPDTGVSVTFSARATVTREDNVGEIIVLPHEVADASLQREMTTGAARFVKVLTLSLTLPSTAVLPSTPDIVCPPSSGLCGKQPPGTWTGGGVGTSSGAINKISNLCIFSGKSDVYVDYTVPTVVDRGRPDLRG